MEAFETPWVRETRHCVDDEMPLEAGRSTLFINAAAKSTKDLKLLSQRPWVVELDLPLTVQEDERYDAEVIVLDEPDSDLEKMDVDADTMEVDDMEVRPRKEPSDDVMEESRPRIRLLVDGMLLEVGECKRRKLSGWVILSDSKEVDMGCQDGDLDAEEMKL